jgi:hypothetical protein
MQLLLTGGMVAGIIRPAIQGTIELLRSVNSWITDHPEKTDDHPD